MKIDTRMDQIVTNSQDLSRKHLKRLRHKLHRLKTTRAKEYALAEVTAPEDNIGLATLSKLRVSYQKQVEDIEQSVLIFYLWQRSQATIDPMYPREGLALAEAEVKQLLTDVLGKEWDL